MKHDCAGKQDPAGGSAARGPYLVRRERLRYLRLILFAVILSLVMGLPATDFGGSGVAHALNATLTQTIPNPAPGVGEEFGHSVAGVGGNILVGAYLDDPGGVTDAGSAYLFDGASGGLLLTVPNPAPAASDKFGFSVAAVGGNILVGAILDDPDGVTDTGSAYLFDGTTGT